jgi:hypothetical protein
MSSLVESLKTFAAILLAVGSIFALQMAVSAARSVLQFGWTNAFGRRRRPELDNATAMDGRVEKSRR